MRINADYTMQRENSWHEKGLRLPLLGATAMLPLKMHIVGLIQSDRFSSSKHSETEAAYGGK